MESALGSGAMGRAATSLNTTCVGSAVSDGTQYAAYGVHAVMAVACAEAARPSAAREAGARRPAHRHPGRATETAASLLASCVRRRSSFLCFKLRLYTFCATARQSIPSIPLSASRSAPQWPCRPEPRASGTARVHSHSTHTPHVWVADRARRPRRETQSRTSMAVRMTHRRSSSTLRVA